MSIYLEGINSEQLQKMLDLSVERGLLKQHLPNSDKPLNSAETCKLLGISTPTLQRMRDEKSIPFRKVNNKLFYNRADVLKAVS